MLSTSAQAYYDAMRQLLMQWLKDIFREAKTPDGPYDLTLVRCWSPCRSDEEALDRIYQMERLVDLLVRAGRDLDSDRSAVDAWIPAVEALISDRRADAGERPRALASPRTRGRLESRHA